MEKIPEELQNVLLPAPAVTRAVAVARPTNEKVREAADARLRFEDEPAAYFALISRA